MAKLRIVLNKSNVRRDGSCPVCLRITQKQKDKIYRPWTVRYSGTVESGNRTF